MGGARGMHGRNEKCLQNIGGKSKRKRAFGKPINRREEICKTDLKEIWTAGFICLSIRSSGGFW
jgi:hypothetical protein